MESLLVLLPRQHPEVAATLQGSLYINQSGAITVHAKTEDEILRHHCNANDHSYPVPWEKN